MTATCASHSHTIRRPLVQRPFRRIALAWSIRRQRRILAALDDERLSDIGLTRRQVRQEAAKPIWDVPAHWLR